MTPKRCGRGQNAGLSLWAWRFCLQPCSTVSFTASFPAGAFSRVLYQLVNSSVLVISDETYVGQRSWMNLNLMAHHSSLVVWLVGAALMVTATLCSALIECCENMKLLSPHRPQSQTPSELAVCHLERPESHSSPAFSEYSDRLYLPQIFAKTRDLNCDDYHVLRLKLKNCRTAFVTETRELRLSPWNTVERKDSYCEKDAGIWQPSQYFPQKKNWCTWLFSLLNNGMCFDPVSFIFSRLLQSWWGICCAGSRTWLN